jgi:hypothetical protein
LNYQQGGVRNDYNRLCRGIVFHQKTGEIHSFPFTRFFNFGEKEAVPVDFSIAEILEKLDGTMVGVSFPTRDRRKPLWQTRKMLSTHDTEFAMKSFYGENFKLMTLIGEFVKQLQFDDSHVGHTWIFEFIHKHTKVITHYEPHQYGLYLIGGRDLTSFDEVCEYKLNYTAREIGAKRGRYWNANSHAEILNLFAQFPKDFEGFVARQRGSANRVKIKSEDYVKVHHLLTKISYKNLLPLWIAGEQDEVVAYFPQAQEKIDKIEIAFNKFVDVVVEKINFWHSKGLERKDLALRLTGQVEDPNVENNSTIRGLIFQHDTEARKGKIDTKQLVIKALKKLSTLKLIEVLNLNDDDEPVAILIEE